MQHIDLIMRFVFAAIGAVLLIICSEKPLQILQLSSYKKKGYIAWFKKTKYEYARRYALLAIFSIAFMAVWWALFSSIAGAIYIGFIGFIVLGVLFVIASKKTPQKTPLVYTKRVWRLTIAACILHFGVLFGLLSLGLLTPIYFVSFSASFYALSAIAYFLIPFTVLLAHIILVPIEKAIQNSYKKRAVRKLKNYPNLIKIGIAGSYGKTSAKNVLAEFLRQKFKVVATPKSYNTPMGICKTISEMEEELAAADFFIVELGERQLGDIKELTDMIKPQFGILTAIGNQHLESFGSLENIEKGIYELIDSLPRDGHAFFNGDNAPIKDRLFDKCLIGKTMSAKDKVEGAMVTYRDGSTSKEGTNFTLVYNYDSISVTTPLLGKHIPSLLTLCAACALHFGVSLEEIAVAAKNLQPVPHRLQLIDRGDTVILDDAYNANPEGAKAALEILEKLEGAKIVVTPGMVELGKEEENVNRQFGRDIAKHADYAILNSSRAVWIRQGCIESGMDESKVFVVDSLTQAMERIAKIDSAKKAILFENDLPDNMS
ncbi:MAG: UDP-N-acetylmuramoyl-tripeptide--D-alanyl-D-alanine ligase [Firmicutes bacterium]|nr:UDP-N-acetylmuramoyl-tripeptide--D-alanyl-D-alanine ligase [Bacillota bacterium]